jgi:hypothetical protein
MFVPPHKHMFRRTNYRQHCMQSRDDDDAKQLIRAQRLAKRIRASAACLPCKAKKAKCNDYRPCARCQKSPGLEDMCIDESPEITRNMYHVDTTLASGFSRDNIGAQGRLSHHVAADFESHGYSFRNFPTMRTDPGAVSSWKETFTTTHMWQVRISQPACKSQNKGLTRGLTEFVIN